MTKKETLEYNKRCAEFLGLSYCDKHLYKGWYKNKEHNERICDLDGLQYHSDWNRIMDVVEAIEKKANMKILGCTADVVGVLSVIAKFKKDAVVGAINQFLILNTLNDQNNRIVDVFVNGEWDASLEKTKHVEIYNVGEVHKIRVGDFDKFVDKLEADGYDCYLCPAIYSHPDWSGVFIFK